LPLQEDPARPGCLSKAMPGCPAGPSSTR